MPLEPLTPLPQFLQPPLPSVFTLELTERCQHHCTGCGNVFTPGSYEMDVTEWAAILNRLWPYAQALRVTGGEPTLHRQFRSLMTAVDALGVPFVLFTNGHWRDPDDTLDVLLKQKHLQGILISLQGVDAKTHQRFTGVDDFATVVNNIQRASQANLRVATNTLLLTTTIEHLSEVVELSLSLGANTVCFGRYYGAPLPGLSLQNDQMRTALRAIACLRATEPRVVLSNCVPACFLPDADFGERGCTSGFTHCTIGPRGEVRPCTHAPLTLGYIQHAELEQLWNSPQLSEWRQRVPVACRSCAAFSRCRGGCRATAYECQMPVDPLMAEPLAHLSVLPSIELAWDSRPRLLGELHEIDTGYALSAPGKYVTLSAQGHRIVLAFDGHMTMAELQDRFGSAAVQLAGSLLYQRLVKLER